MYLIGKVLKTHGVRGEVKVDNYSDFDRFKVGHIITINHKDYKIKSVRSQNDILLISFVGFNNLDDVLHLRGNLIYTNVGFDEDELEEDEYHIPSLIDKPVFNEENQLLGNVITFLEVANGYLMEIIKLDGKKALIPFRNEFIKDISDEKIIIKVIEGLI